MKPYQKIEIKECNEPLIAIPRDKFIVENPPPYQKLGANYGDKSPYYLRRGVLDALIKTPDYLDTLKKGWKIKVFDAYRPLQVQQFMVDYTFDLLVKKEGLKIEELLSETQSKIWEQVYKFWAIPSDNPATPPPHSTGAAIDITLVDNHGITVNMGGEIDEVSEISYPDFYKQSNSLIEQEYHQNRLLLNQVMEYAGFLRHPNEWWHFSLGDQFWAWLQNQKNQEAAITKSGAEAAIARYGRI